MDVQAPECHDRRVHALRPGLVILCGCLLGCGQPQPPASAAGPTGAGSPAPGGPVIIGPTSSDPSAPLAELVLMPSQSAVVPGTDVSVTMVESYYGTPLGGGHISFATLSVSRPGVAAVELALQ